MASERAEGGPTDEQPADAQKKKPGSLKEKLMKCPDACWKVLTNCYKTKKNESTSPGSNYKMPHSSMGKPPETRPSPSHDELPNRQPEIPSEEREEGLASQATKTEEVYEPPLLDTYESKIHTVNSLIKTGVFVNAQDVRVEAEKWARPLRFNYLLHTAFLNLVFSDFSDLANKLKEDSELVDKFKEIGDNLSSEPAVRKDEKMSLIIISDAISIFSKKILEHSIAMTMDEREQLMEFMGQIRFSSNTQLIRHPKESVSVFKNEKFNSILKKVGFSNNSQTGQTQWLDSNKDKLTAAFFLIRGTFIRKNTI